MSLPKSKFKLSFTKLAKLHGTTLDSIKHWASEGYDLDDDELVKKLVVHGKANAGQLPTTKQTPVKLKINTDKGMSASLSRLENVEVTLAEQYVAAKAKGDPMSPIYQKEWLQIQSALKNTAKDLPDVSEANNHSVPTHIVKQGTATLFNHLRTFLDGLPTRLTEGLPHDIAIGVHAVIKKQITKEIKALQALDFSKKLDAVR